MRYLNKLLVENVEGRNDLTDVRRNAIQMSSCIDKMLQLKFPKIEMLQWVGVLIKFGILFKC